VACGDDNEQISIRVVFDSCYDWEKGVPSKGREKCRLHSFARKDFERKLRQCWKVWIAEHPAGRVVGRPPSSIL